MNRELPAKLCTGNTDDATPHGLQLVYLYSVGHPMFEQDGSLMVLSP